MTVPSIAPVITIHPKSISVVAPESWSDETINSINKMLKEKANQAVKDTVGPAMEAAHTFENDPNVSPHQAVEYGLEENGIISSVYVTHNHETHAMTFSMMFDDMKYSVQVSNAWLSTMSSQGIEDMLTQRFAGEIAKNWLEPKIKEKTESLNFKTGGVIEGKHQIALTQQTSLDKLRDTWKDSDRVVDCPECVKSKGVWGLIQHLNDKHEWSRHQIAGWIEEQDIDINVGKEEE